MADLHRQLTDLLDPADASRLDRFARISPLYRRHLTAHPADVAWLVQPPASDESRDQEILNEWRAFRGDLPRESACFLPALRKFRRRMSMRIAFRDVNRLQSCARCVADLSLLADLCVRECYALATARWTEREGEPWDEAIDRPARFCVLALGKLGGWELNFSSDIDLIYFYEGEGSCRTEGRIRPFSNARFFTKVAETFTQFLQEPTEHGFLFRVDLRLRPEGNRSPLVRSFAGMENYYAATGQSWERMALIKARPVAGDFALGGELLESLHSFRYPRHPPPSLLTEIAAMKTRTEQEVVGAANLRRDVKSGYGGIREIEFIVQTMQVLHAGRFPFLQTASTVDGLDQLLRYELMNREDARFLQESYWFLRTLEHRVQIREEQQTHTLPTDPEQLGSIAESLGFKNAAALDREIETVREGVRSRYDQLLQSAPVDEEFGDWWLFFSEQKALPRVADCLRRWFGEDEAAPGTIRDFVQGDRNFLLTRDQVARFTSLTRRFDRVMPRLAAPLVTLRRIARFAESYGTRRQFLATCSLDPSFFEVLGLLFDRSEFIHELLCQHPEVLDEVLRPEILRRKKSTEDTLRELAEAAPEEAFEDWLWRYVKAEQIRIAIGDLLGYLDLEQTERALSDLADATVTFLLRRFDPQGRLLVVALGKYGGREFTFGSDLDLVCLTEGPTSERDERIVRSLTQSLSRRTPLGTIYDVDLRLRPHGEAGLLAPTLPALRRYYNRSAQGWEKQVLSRARPVAGNPELRSEFSRFLDELLYRREATDRELQELWEMRSRIERERDAASPPQRAFKTGPGGIVDLEFFGQFLQLRHGHRRRELRQPNTRKLLRTIGRLRLIAPADLETLLDNFNFLKQVEVLLRRDRNAAISVIGPSPDEQFALARWSGFKNRDEFWGEQCRCMTSTRQIVGRYLVREFNLDLHAAPGQAPPS